MIPLNTLSVIEFSGHDARQFLHNQVSADINNINAGTAGFACYCNPAGRVLGLLLVFPVNDGVIAICASELAVALTDLLKRFIIRADVKIKVRDDLSVMASVQDKMTEALHFLKTDPGLNYAIVEADKDFPAGGEQSAQDWKSAELKKGIVWLDNETSATFLPQMLGFESIGALSFKKGCYPGQEIIARIRYLGTLKRRPLVLRIAGGVALAIKEKISLNFDGDTSSAVLVDQAAGSSGDQTLFLVARTSEDIKPESILSGEQLIEVLNE